MSSGSYSGTATLEGSVVGYYDGRDFEIDDYELESLQYYSDDDVYMDKSDFRDFLSDCMYDIKDLIKQEVVKQGIVVDRNTYADIEAEFEIETDYSGYWDDGYFYNYDRWEPPESGFEIGENRVDISVDVVSAEIKEYES